VIAGKPCEVRADHTFPRSVPFGVGSVKRQGTDATVVALGYMVYPALAAAEQLSLDGVSIEIVDPRTLVPLDVELIRQSVQKTGRLIVVDKSAPTCSMASEIVPTSSTGRPCRCAGAAS
jgi:pyruvate dehydrogenase E1 component beta subunit